MIEKIIGRSKIMPFINVKTNVKISKENEVAIKTMLGISPKVHLVAPKTIVRSEGKAVRVIDHRKLHD